MVTDSYRRCHFQAPRDAWHGRRLMFGCHGRMRGRGRDLREVHVDDGIRVDIDGMTVVDVDGANRFLFLLFLAQLQPSKMWSYSA